MIKLSDVRDIRSRRPAVVVTSVLAILAGLALLSIEYSAFVSRGDRPAASSSSGQWLLLNWEDLSPPASPLPNPVLELRPDQASLFYAAVSWRMFSTTGNIDGEQESRDAESKASAEDAQRELIKQGVEVASMLDRYVAYYTEVDRRRMATRNEYDGRLVAIVGYLLPLDFDTTGAREFLLVPYVGACIHVPPPPPNRIVYVKTERPFKTTGMFETVQVIGRMTVAPVSRSLQLVDGAAKVAAGYSIQAEAINAIVNND